MDGLMMIGWQATRRAVRLNQHRCYFIYLYKFAVFVLVLLLCVSTFRHSLLFDTCTHEPADRVYTNK